MKVQDGGFSEWKDTIVELKPANLVLSVLSLRESENDPDPDPEPPKPKRKYRARSPPASDDEGLSVIES